jgi:hypothetical protein
MKKIFSSYTRCTVRTMLMHAVLVLITATAVLAAPSKSPLEGRWDMTIDWNGKPAPGWLEVRHSGNNTLVGQTVINFGSARPIAKINFDDGKLSFAIPPQWDKGDKDLVFEGTLDGDNINGTLTYTDGSVMKWTAVRAPALRPDGEVKWGKPLQLFNGKDLTGWDALGSVNQWVVDNGVLKSPKSGSNIATDQAFSDFKLHVEFRYPTESNSGVYLRGRYEVQIIDCTGPETTRDSLGAVYGFISPSEVAPKGPGEWQSYDITLVGRFVTIAVNGKEVVHNQEIPGITGGALDSKEGEPGPIYFQGDHGPIEFRNITIATAK